MKKKVLLAVGLVGMLLLGACGSAKSDMATAPEAYYKSESVSNSSSYDGFGYSAGGSYSATSDSYAEYDTEKPRVEETSGSISGETYHAESEKLIRTIRMRLQTKEFDALLSYLEGKVAEVGGYVQSSQIYGNAADSYGYRSADLTYRIPQNHLDVFVAGVGENATVVYKTENAENVTLQYADTESRLKALEIEQERFLALLEQANDV